MGLTWPIGVILLKNGKNFHHQQGADDSPQWISETLENVRGHLGGVSRRVGPGAAHPRRAPAFRVAGERIAAGPAGKAKGAGGVGAESAMKRCLLDANVILRFLRNDDPVQAPQARALLVRAQRGDVDLAVSILTLAEVFYALRTSYKLSRPAAADALVGLLRTGVLEVERQEVIAAALARVSSANVDLGDAMLAAEAAASGDEVASFDRDFNRFPEIKRHVWSNR